MKPKHNRITRQDRPHDQERRESNISGMADRQRRDREEPGSASNSSGDARLFGLMPVLEALRAGVRQVEEISIAEGAHDHRFHELMELAREAKVPVRRVPRSALARTGGPVHQGVVARVAAARYADTDSLFSLLAAKVGTENPPLVTVLDGVEDPRNLGAILRTVDCAGGDGVLIPERRAVGLTDIVAKSSAGAVEHIPIARVTNVSRAIDELKSIGIWTVGASADAKTEYVDWDWTLPAALVLGNEGSGLHRLVREHCDTLVRIPVFGRIDSLNVSVAAGVILYEARRQRQKAKLEGVAQRSS
jgi:23S rRNA (guanosine2251-2'-O)-methyltransferase